MQPSNKKVTIFLIYFLMLISSGCSLWHPKSQIAQNITKSQPLLSNYWTLHSKVGIKTAENNGSAQLLWKQIGNRYKVSLIGPLGKSLGSLESDGEKVTLKSSDGTIQTADTEDQLSLALIGKPLPITQLQFWIKGLKAPFFPIQPISASADELEFIQRGWRIKMKGFQVVEGYKLPKRLILSYPSSNAKPSEVELQIIMKQWTIPTETTYESL
jgi:outer membrane lipoprotein LolB